MGRRAGRVVALDVEMQTTRGAFFVPC